MDAEGAPGPKTDDLTDGPTSCAGSASVAGAMLATGNALPVLSEILQALEKLAADGEATVIDLRAMPFLPGDEDFLFETLGTGEISAELSALGRTVVTETATSGVWLVEHRDESDNPIAKFIEITRIPELLITPSDDLSDGVEALRDTLEKHRPPSAG